MSFRESQRAGGTALEWLLPSPISGVVESSGYRVDLTVAHNLASGVEPADADLPRVLRINSIEALDGGELGADELHLDLRVLAIDTVVAYTRIGWFMVRAEGEETWQAPDPNNDHWRVVARMIRAACFESGGRMRWSDQVNERLIEMVSHLSDHGCGTVSDIADELGTTPARVHTQLSQLRKRYEIPQLKPGRPSK